MAKYYFPEEIIPQILLRISHVKSHVRFTCVNKSWRSIIESPSFVSAHVAHTNGSDNNDNSSRLLLLKLSSSEVVTACLGKFGEQITEEGKHKSKSLVEYTELRFPCKSLSCSFDVVGSCNGLVLLRRYTNTLIILWNPSIRKFASLPKPDNADCEGCKLASTGWGFGFDSLKNDYKVVKIVNHVEINGDMKVDSHVQVFSLNSGSWKTIGAVGVPGCRFLNNQGPRAFINGAIYWVTIARIEEKVLQNIVLSFDVSNEVFREIRLPTEIAYAFPSLLSISVYGKTVAVCVGSASFLYMRCMWVMTECKSWTKLFTFDTKENIPNPLAFTKAGELLWETDGGELASYDPKSQKMVNHSVNGGRWGFCFADSHVETLVLLNEATEQTKQQGRLKKKRKTRKDDKLSGLLSRSPRDNSIS
jgi:F-box interacting protein